ncbi:MAG: NAD+ synthase [Spirochaetes bacterium GWF1_51_8]|nr:MAG: NAD+ synthase [Spirochaetes bacterium GWF1_51_8]
MRVLRFALAQINTTVGDIDGNLKKMKDAVVRASDENADVLIFPELTIPGYPPEDLVYKAQFIDSNINALKELADFTSSYDMLIFAGFIDREDDIYNAAAVLHRGNLVDIYRKIYLPNYGVFDEKRYFASGSTIPIYIYKNVRIGYNICEDLWYPDGPGHYQASVGDAEVILNASASPYQTGKQEFREKMYSARAGDEIAVLMNCNLIGGQDELVFDGTSTAYDETGSLIARLEPFSDDFQCFDINVETVFLKRLKDIRRRERKTLQTSPFPIKEFQIGGKQLPSAAIEKPPFVNELADETSSIYRALVLGTRDYMNKNGFKDALIAVSGGIDSALVAAIAAEAIGPERVHGIYLPSRFSASISGEDAHLLAKNLGIDMHELAIQPLFEDYLKTLEAPFQGKPFDTTEENLQSRIRGNIIMALSNKFNWLVLTTGNKSEMSTGYATLYGDMAGGFAVIKDVLKTVVYRLADYINCENEVIPRRIIDRPPSAELRPDQKDTDSLPEYDILDRIICAYVEEDWSLEAIVKDIGDEGLVKRVMKLIDRSEYKRRQAPPGIKITPRAFGRDRRMPITNRYQA